MQWLFTENSFHSNYYDLTFNFPLHDIRNSASRIMTNLYSRSLCFVLCIERDKNLEGVLPESNIKGKSSAVLKKNPQPVQWFKICHFSTVIYLSVNRTMKLLGIIEEWKGKGPFWMLETAERQNELWECELKQRLVWAKWRFMGEGNATLSCDVWALPRNTVSWVTTKEEKKVKKDNVITR